MPNRILREGILESQRIHALGPMSELFYRRLMSVVDDFGRYSASVPVLLSRCFPTRPPWADEQLVKFSLAECATMGLLRVYTVGRNDYLEMIDFRQLVRAKVSKFPECSVDAVHMRANENICDLSTSHSLSVPSPSPSPNTSPDTTPTTSPSPKSKTEDFELIRVAEAMHARHPNHGCGKSVIRKQLTTILRTIAESKHPETLVLINQNHALWCETEDWKRGYAKGLENWLAPTMERWRDPPGPQAPRSNGKRPETVIEQMIREAGEKP